jgi:hypothetical protein
MNIAGALLFSIGPALAPMVLAADRGSAGAILRLRQVR